MTTKSPSRKQVIISMRKDNRNKFIEDSNNHVTNLNRALKNIKSDILINFIRKEYSGITIIIHKSVLALDLQTIENYIKNANSIKAKGVKIP